MRGKVYSKGVGQIYSGITPACAGKRPACPAESALVEDHPRVCGEKLRLSLFFASSLGSPPRVRGKADVRRRGAYTSRITPACAGKRHSDCTGNSAHRDHPRVCGEKLSCRCPVLSRLGSPPRVRGKGAMPDGIAGHHRITPACAGKREKGLWRFCEYKDHPRVCGEKNGRKC